MTSRIYRMPRVSRDLVELALVIAQDKIEPAMRFLEVAEASFELLAGRPFAGRKWETPYAELSGVRVYPMPGAYRSYLVFYRPVNDGIELLAIFHGTRDLERSLWAAAKQGFSE